MRTLEQFMLANPAGAENIESHLPYVRRANLRGVVSVVGRGRSRGKHYGVRNVPDGARARQRGRLDGYLTGTGLHGGKL
jgi:hypothetical protein